MSSGHRSHQSKDRGDSPKGPALQESLLRLNKWRVLRGKKKFAADQIMVICPHCLQNSECVFKILLDAGNCRKCGKCSIKGLVEVTARHNVPLYFAAGGSAAVKLVMDPNVKAVIAVACGKELFAGLLRAMKKKIFTIHVGWPKGPCKDTFADSGEVEEAIRFLLGKK